MSGGGLVILSVPSPVISRLLSLTCDSPKTWPISCAKVHALAPLATKNIAGKHKLPGVTFYTQALGIAVSTVAG